jgi:glycosyltransferase involved in cell wall biosynthesis
MCQRPQQLAEAFVDIGFVAIFGTMNYTTDSVKTTRKVRDGLYLINEKFFPLFSHVFHPEEVIYFCMWPNNRKHLEYIPCDKIIYDYMDELCLLDLPKSQIIEDHCFMMKHADLITVSSDKLLQDIPFDYHAKAILMPNAVSESFIEELKIPTCQPSEMIGYADRPVIGYYGAIAKWFDPTLVARLCYEFPRAIIMLIGPIEQGIHNQIKEMEINYVNIVVLPPKPQNELIPYLQRFDVCIIPFLKNPVTDAVSPVKLFEYLAAGKPVVTTDLYECRKYSTVRIATSHEEFVEQVRAALVEGNDPGFKNSQIVLASANTWQRRAHSVISRLETLSNRYGSLEQ